TPPAPPPEPPAPAAAPRRDWRPLRIALGILLLVTSAVVFVTSRGGGGTAAASGIALEGADVPGPQAFTPSVSAARPTSLASAATRGRRSTGSPPGARRRDRASSRRALLSFSTALRSHACGARRGTPSASPSRARARRATTGSRGRASPRAGPQWSRPLDRRR